MSEQVQHSDPALSQATTQILAATKNHTGNNTGNSTGDDHPVSVFVLRGPLQRDWSAQYKAQGLSHVVETTLANLAADMDADTSGARKLVHVTDGLPAETLTEAQENTRALTRLADLVVFTPQSPERQRIEGLLTSWPSFWGLCFLSEGFVLQDTVRPAIWNTPSAHWDVLQGLVLFTPSDTGQATGQSTGQAPAQVVDYAHPSQIDVQLATIEEFKNTMEILTQTGAFAAAPPPPPPPPAPAPAETASPDAPAPVPAPAPVVAEPPAADLFAADDLFSGAEMFSRISLAMPKRYGRAEYERRLFNVTKPWWRVALRYPWKIGYWNDLWRLQRRLKRHAGG